MANEVEELDTLFDYTRSCLEIVPLDDEDDDDSIPVNPSKRRKSSDSDVEKGGEVINIGDAEDKDDDLEWLEPPPKVVIDKTKICENSVIKELRKKRQELMSFTESAKDVLQAVEESVKRDLETLTSSAPESKTEKPSKAAAERPKIVISIQDKDGVKQFRVYTDDKFERLFKMYADKEKSKVESLVFSFDGDKVNPAATPSSLGMEDEDLIEVCVKSS